MADGEDTHKGFSTCFENMPFAETMRKMMDRKGVGSLCAEMMKKIVEQEGDCSSHCEEIIRKMVKEGIRGQEEPEADKDDKAK